MIRQVLDKFSTNILYDVFMVSFGMITEITECHVFFLFLFFIYFLYFSHYNRAFKITVSHVWRLLYSKRIYSANGILRYFFPRISKKCI